MTKSRKLTAKHCSGGLNVGAGALNIKPEENVESRNMEYTIDGAVSTSLGYDDVGIDLGENNSRVDGMHVVANYPDLVFTAVNGKIKYADFSESPQSSASAYEADPALSLTPGNMVFMKDYRGMLYFTNGVEALGRIAIGKLSAQLSTTPTTYNHSYVSSSYSWTLSASGTNEYYLRTSGSADPRVSTPVSVTIGGSTATEGTVGSLSAGQWDYGDNDSLGYSTIYVRLSDGTDPDTKTSGYIYAEQRAAYLSYAEGYKFTDGYDKIYIQGDEIDYTDELDQTAGDVLLGVTNVSSTHPSGSYVTQYNSISSAPKGTTIAFFRDTMWVGGITNEPGVLRYSKTINTVGNINNIHDFSDGYNYIIGDGGDITALQATDTRLYVFMKDKVHFIPIVYDSSGLQVFDVSHLFTGVYGCPNPYCVTEMEDVVVFFTGSRLIRIGYDPSGQKLIPDEAFDREILPLLQEADVDQSDARLSYNPNTKELRLKYIRNGVSKVIKYHKQVDKYSGPVDEDATCYVIHEKKTYFGDVVDDIIWKAGKSIDSAGENTTHRFQNGRIDGGSKNMKLFKKGCIRGKKNRGSSVYLLTKIDDKNFGAARLIPENCMDLSATSTPLGEAVTGGDEIGLSGDTNNLFPFTYRFLLGRRGKDFSFSVSSEDSGAVWQLSDYEVEWEESDYEPRTNY